LKPKAILPLVFIVLVLLSFPQASLARVEWRDLGEIDLQQEPLDIVTNLNGKILFILVPGKVLIYSVPRKEVTGEVPYEGEFDKLLVSLQTKRLILYNSSRKRIRIIEPEVIQRLDYSGSPFIGPSRAPVTVAVFSDYQ